MNEQALLPVEEKTVLFYEDEITAVVVERNDKQEIYVPLRPICDYLGVDWSAQRQRVNRDPVLSKYVSGVVITPTPLSKYTNPQEMVCLRLDYLNGWLFGINASRVKEEVRDRLLRYQEKCYRILADAFLIPGMAIQPVDSRDEVLSQLHNMALVIADTSREMIQARHLAETGVQLAQTNTQRLDRAATVVSRLTLLPQTGTQWLDRARLLYFVSSLLERNGDKAAARPVIREALQVCQERLDPDNGQAAALQALIESLHETIAG